MLGIEQRVLAQLAAYFVLTGGPYSPIGLYSVKRPGAAPNLGVMNLKMQEVGQQAGYQKCLPVYTSFVDKPSVRKSTLFQQPTALMCCVG